MTDGHDISSEIALRWTSLDLNDDKSTLVQVMAWCHQATSHYLNQYWPRSLPLYGITKPQWVDHVHKGHESIWPWINLRFKRYLYFLAMIITVLSWNNSFLLLIFNFTSLLPLHHCPACRTTFIATRFRVAVICPIIPVPHCIRVFFYFVWFVFINHIFQFYYELCTYCNILDIYLS